MSIVLSNPLRTAACQVVVLTPDQGVDAGRLKIRTVVGAVLATFILPKPAFDVPVLGVATAFGGDGINHISVDNPLVTIADSSGVANKYSVEDSEGTVLWTGTISNIGGGGDLQLSTTLVLATLQITLAGWTHTHPA